MNGAVDQNIRMQCNTGSHCVQSPTNGQLAQEIHLQEAIIEENYLEIITDSDSLSTSIPCNVNIGYFQDGQATGKIRRQR